MIYYSDYDSKRRNGVAFVLQKTIGKSVIGFNPVNERIITIRIKGHPTNITLIQVYAPTTSATEEEIEVFYSKLQETIDTISGKDMLLLIYW